MYNTKEKKENTLRKKIKIIFFFLREYRTEDYLPTSSSQQFYYNQQMHALNHSYLPQQEVSLCF